VAQDLLALMWVPFLMCLVLTGIHAYLGLHVIAREVIFVDIALAQIAALGATAAFLWGYDLESWGSYVFGLTFTILGASVFALTRSRERRVSQEAVIGVVYAVSAAAAVLVADRTPHGAEHLRSMLVGSILAVRGSEVINVACLYAVIGLFHWLCRRPFLLISTNPDKAYDDGWRVRRWDFLFYAAFGLVVTSSVKVSGVLAVFSYLIVPVVCATLLGRRGRAQLHWAWAIGFVLSVLGAVFSYLKDWPMGATIVCLFGVTVAIISLSVRMKYVDAKANGEQPAVEGSR
jgi:zinc/manganese transport system permease protein